MCITAIIVHVLTYFSGVQIYGNSYITNSQLDQLSVGLIGLNPPEGLFFQPLIS